MAELTIDEFTFGAAKTQIYSEAISQFLDIATRAQLQTLLELMYVTLGLTGETGEIANKVKKLIRDGDSNIANLQKAIDDERGDVLWYLAQPALGFGNRSLSGSAKANLVKLEDRKERGVISGSGDNR